MESYEAHHRNHRKYYEQKKKNEEKVKEETAPHNEHQVEVWSNTFFI